MSMTPSERRCRRCGATREELDEHRARPAEGKHFCGPCGEELGAAGRDEYLRLALLAA